MLKFYYNPFYKYTNRTILDVSSDEHYKDIDYENIDTPDTINGHIIYTLDPGENIPTYIVENNTRKWYVTGITQLRTGKYQISLLRDIISENPDLWSKEQAYVEAGTATDYCRYKKWGLPFTNTKIKEERLDINGKSSFFVFYTNQQNNTDGKLSEDDLKLSYEAGLENVTSDYQYDDIEDIPGYEYINIGKFIYTTDEKGSLTFSAREISSEYDPYYGSNDYYKAVKITEGNQNRVNPSVSYPLLRYKYKGQTYTSYNAIMTSISPGSLSLTLDNGMYDIATFIKRASWTYRESLTQSVSDPNISYSNVNISIINQLNNMIGKVIRVPDENNPALYKFYKLSKPISSKYWRTEDVEPNAAISMQLLNQCKTLDVYPLGENKWTDLKSGGSSFYKFELTENICKYELTELGTGTSFDFNLIANTNKLPKSNVRCVNIVSDNMVSDDLIMKSLMLAQINPQAQDDNIGRIIDIQYLPFQVATEQNVNIKFGNHNAIAEFLTNDDFSYFTDMENLTNINKETDSIIVVSPSRKSQFKFSPYYNDGVMEFSTRITIKPMQSVIYVRPSTKGLLMQDWDDKDCLIIQEDFSLTSTNSAWTNYVNTNRNYQNTFNLQVQTKEYERGWERKIEQAQAKSDIWTASNISAQRAKTFSGNIPIISDIAGAIHGTTNPDMNYMKAAQLDREYNEAMHQKSLEISRTTFEYQLDNVKSQPLIPNTITAIDVKLLDGIYLEFYSTNATELESISNYYVNNGNRIDNYGTFAKYWGNFVRGKIIRSINYNQPEVDELNLRLQSGIYTGGIV